MGGVTLGAVMAALAAAVSAIGATSTALLGIAAGIAVLGATVDAGVLGFAPPFFKRQVNEYWLTRYRAWVYGSGFGWQIGAGITTYIMTAAVFVTVAFGALTAGPWAALVLGVGFGLARGLAVLLTARRHTTTELFALHRRFDALGEPVRRAVIVVQLAVAVVAAGAAWGVVAALAVAGVLTVAALAATLGVASSRRRRRPSPPDAALAAASLRHRQLAGRGRVQLEPDRLAAVAQVDAPVGREGLDEQDAAAVLVELDRGADGSAARCSRRRPRCEPSPDGTTRGPPSTIRRGARRC